MDIFFTTGRAKRKEAGFSLMGLIIAIFITAVSLVAFLAVASHSLKGASLSKHRLIAAGLAQEGIELTRFWRASYSNWDGWYSIVNNRDYIGDYNDSQLFLMGAEKKLMINNSGFYQYSGGDDTPFYRKMSLTKVSNDQVKAVVEIKWNIKGDWRYLTVEDRLWNWR